MILDLSYWLINIGSIKKSRILYISSNLTIFLRWNLKMKVLSIQSEVKKYHIDQFILTQVRSWG